MLLLGIGLVITGLSFIEYKRALRYYLVYQVFWFPVAQVMQLGDFSVTISMLMNVVFFLVYLFKYRFLYRRDASAPMPFCRPFALIFVSFLATCFTSLAGVSDEFTRGISNIIQDYLLVYILWNVMDTQEDEKKIANGMVIVFLIAGIYSAYEYVLQDNPFANYKSLLNEVGITLYSETAEALRRGYRITSLFEHPIGAGLTLSLFVLYFLYKFSENEKFKPQVFELLSYVAVLLCLLGIILTKMRSSLFFLLIGMVAVINFKKRFFYKLLLLGCIGTVFLLPIFKENFNVFWSMFNQAAQREVGGSSFAMRVEQFQAIYHIFLDSPIAGLGDEFENFVTQNIFTQKALGYESIWFIQMTRHGLIGVIANLYLAYYTIIKVPRVYGSAKARCLGLAYWLTYTLTSIPSFRISLFYLLYFYCLKCSETYNNVQCGQNKKIIDATCLLPALMRHRIRRKEK